MAAELEITGELKRNRKANFTSSECTIILEEAEKHLDIIKSKFSTVITNKKKKETWKDITSKVNALGVSERTPEEIKDKWRAMVSTAKKKHNKVAKTRKETGGGKKPASPTPTTIKIIDLFGEDPSFSGISGGLESSSSFSTLDLSDVAGI
ncbi:t-SNARE domain-containing protein 1-like [Exaiptasia diaphana]|uniref:Myb/SANT-like DNA-binding domain-containing protein n=1 Tax=Exaiptasia diaphana TaxID=2652724 RepID=A0A913XWS9_EXADI|nr:t-SNARE domain-containing protein 1-like [Exaiptasia diaphana]